MSEYVFKREAVRRFHFTECVFDAATGVDLPEGEVGGALSVGRFWRSGFDPGASSAVIRSG